MKRQNSNTNFIKATPPIVPIILLLVSDTCWPTDKSSKWNLRLTVSGGLNSRNIHDVTFLTLENDKNIMTLQSKIFFLTRKYPWKIIWDRKKLVRVRLRPYTQRYNTPQYLRYNLIKSKCLHLAPLKLQYERGVECSLENNQKGGCSGKTQARF